MLQAHLMDFQRILYYGVVESIQQENNDDG